MNSGALKKATLSVDFRKNRIRIHKNAIHALDDPEYILFLVNPEERTLAIMRSDRSDLRAHRIIFASLTGMKSCELNSKSLVRGLLNIYAGWEDNTTYRIDGESLPGKGVIMFNIENSVSVCETEEEGYGRK